MENFSSILSPLDAHMPSSEGERRKEERKKKENGAMEKKGRKKKEKEPVTAEGGGGDNKGVMRRECTMENVHCVHERDFFFLFKKSFLHAFNFYKFPKKIL